MKIHKQVSERVLVTTCKIPFARFWFLNSFKKPVLIEKPIHIQCQ